MTIYQKTVQLFQLAQMDNFKECINYTYNTDKYWHHFQWFFTGPENHLFRVISSRGVARNFSRRRMDVGYHGWERTFCDFRLAKIFTSGIVLACVLNPPSKPQPRIFFLSLRALKNVKRENRLRQTTMQAQIIPTCCTYLIITFILISEQPTNTSFIKYYLWKELLKSPQTPIIFWSPFSKFRTKSCSPGKGRLILCWLFLNIFYIP